MRTKLEEWLEIIPAADHGIARIAFSGGAFRFAKQPVSRCRDMFDPQSGLIAGPVRPLLCPEPPPAGCEFSLTWDSGNGWWAMSLVEILRFSEVPLVETARKMHAGALAELAGADPSKAHETTPVLQALDEAAKLGAPADAVALAFLAGSVFSNRSVLNRTRPEIERGTQFEGGKTSRDSDWYDIIGAAVERHGNVTPTALLEILGGRRRFYKNTELPLDFDLSEAHWDFCLNSLLPPIEWERFAKIVNKVKTTMKVEKIHPLRKG